MKLGLVKSEFGEPKYISDILYPIGIIEMSVIECHRVGARWSSWSFESCSLRLVGFKLNSSH